MAATVRVEVEFGDWARGLDALLVRCMRATYTATREASLLVEREGKQLLRLTSHPEGTPTPARPSSPPSLVTGNLRRSWRTRPPHPGVRPWTVEAETGPTAKYARIQELGGRAGRRKRTRLPKRPYVRPAVRISYRVIHRVYVARWSAAVRGITV